MAGGDLGGVAVDFGEKWLEIVAVGVLICFDSSESGCCPDFRLGAWPVV